MKRLVSGVLVIGLGILIVSGYLVSGGPPGEGNNRAGQFPVLVFGSLLLAVGVFYSVWGLKEVSQPPKGKRRKPKEPRRK
jgi:hypothetical protein